MFGFRVIKATKHYCVQGLQDQKNQGLLAPKKCRCFSYNDVDTFSCPKTPFMPAKKRFWIVIIYLYFGVLLIHPPFSSLFLVLTAICPCHELRCSDFKSAGCASMCWQVGGRAAPLLEDLQIKIVCCMLISEPGATEPQQNVNFQDFCRQQIF